MGRHSTIACLVALAPACVQPNPAFVDGDAEATSAPSTGAGDDSSGSTGDTSSEGTGGAACPAGMICLGPPELLIDLQSPADLDVADLDDDGLDDVLLGVENGAWVLAGGGGVVQLSAGALAPNRALAADVDDDGDLDGVFSTASGGMGPEARIFLNQGQLDFVAVAIDLALSPTGVAIIDIDGDGIRDFAGANGAEIEYALAVAPVDFSGGSAVEPAPGATDLVAFGPIADKTCTLATTTTAGVRLLGYDGVDWEARDLLGGASTTALGVGDFDGDGTADLLVGIAEPPAIAYLAGIPGQWELAPAVTVPLSTSPRDLAVGDFDGDGQLDVVAVHLDPLLSVLRGGGDGTWTVEELVITQPGRYVGAGDTDGNGRDDVVISEEGGNVVVMRSP